MHHSWMRRGVGVAVFWAVAGSKRSWGTVGRLGFLGCSWWLLDAYKSEWEVSEWESEWESESE